MLYDAEEVPDLTRSGVHIVEGSLHLPESTLEDREDRQFVFVDGDLSCRQLWTSGWWFVRGSLETELLVGRSGSNNMLCATSIVASALLDFGHSINALGALRADVIYSQNIVSSENESVHHRGMTRAELFFHESFFARMGVWTTRPGATAPSAGRSGDVDVRVAYKAPPR